MPAPIDIPRLKSERLILEPLGAKHSAGMFSLWSLEAVCRYSGPAIDFDGRAITLPARSTADSDKIIDFFVRHAAAGRGFRWALITRQDNAFIGALGFNALGTCPEIGYHLHPAYWGRGLMSEACSEAFVWLRTVGAANEVQAHIEPDNVASINLARRLGFRSTGEVFDRAARYVARLHTVGGGSCAGR